MKNKNHFLNNETKFIKVFDTTKIYFIIFYFVVWFFIFIFDF